MAFNPTSEQQAALDLFLSGDSMVIDAGAGTGKTSTLALLAASTQRSGRYLAYNKAIVVDVQGRLPERCVASTAHSLAFREVGVRYKRRLASQRMKSHEVARFLGIQPFDIVYGGQRKRLSPGYLAGHVMRAVANFTQSADREPSARHFSYIDGIDLPDAAGKRTWTNNDAVRRTLEGALRKAWQDIVKVDGVLRFTHDAYLKIWALGDPRIDSDYILLDEAQDTNPVLAGVLAAQDHAQLVYVGDENQAIYGWRGAIDAMGGFGAEHRRQLTQSFRFGPAVAAQANHILGMLDTTLRIKGLDSIDSTVGELDDPWATDAILCRTNAASIETVLNAQKRGRPVHLVGGGTEVAAFARAARDLMTGRACYHPELACFNSWGEVQDYVENDPQGSELSLLVRLVDDFGVDDILSAVDGTTPEGPGVVTVSTAHKAKGREWPVVRIAGDFVSMEAGPEELRLRYVAFTRARQHLDNSVFSVKAERPREV